MGHPLSERLRKMAADIVKPVFWPNSPASDAERRHAIALSEAADALDSAAAANAEHERFVADVLHIRGEIEWLGVENERLRGALTDLLELAKQYLNETGGCDHSVNICVCDIKGTIENTRAALAKLTTTEAKK